MGSSTDETLKQQVREYWNGQPCGTQFAESERYTRAYFDEIEEHRYRTEPEIFSFAQFTRHHGQKILEVGVGAGSDFIQWLRAGTEAYGLDATPEGVAHVRQRAETYGLTPADIRVGDCEALPYEDNTFDLVYSWGVIHHTPDTPKALREIIRVTRPGGRCKVMIYHRHSLLAFFFWVKWAVLKGKPWKSPAWCLFHHMESVGTKAYTRGEARAMLAGQPVEHADVRTVLTFYDRLERFGTVAKIAGRIGAWLFGGDRVGWFLTIEVTKRS